ncbi:MAG TPA: helix-turn-helix transcriptional regulator [Streptosporangiaceae bacterium]|nr:helix-turn-helix transcriptional regulator [Streptosporangiaceae bacterium]
MPVTRGRRKRADSRYAEQAALLASQLRERRESAGITQERLAALAGVGVATVRKIETGAVVEPGYFTVLALMAALATSPGQLETPTAGTGLRGGPSLVSDCCRPGAPKAGQQP